MQAGCLQERWKRSNMDKLLKLKPWILFAVMMFPSMIANIVDLAGFWYLVSAIWCGLIYTCWLFSIGITFSKESTSRFAIGLFKTGVIYSLIYSLLVFYDASDTSEFFPLWQIPLHFIAVFFVFYLIFFVAKNLIQFEINHHFETKSFFLTFCAIWFFPIGIFFVQPRINQIINHNIKRNDIDEKSDSLT